MAKNDRRAYFKKRYGLTPDQVDAAIAIRLGRCDICSKEKSLNVDHDHDTGRVRGMLCHQCNLALGQMADDPVRLRAAADYLEAYEGPRGDLHHRGP